MFTYSNTIYMWLYNTILGQIQHMNEWLNLFLKGDFSNSCDHLFVIRIPMFSFGFSESVDCLGSRHKYKNYVFK